MHLCNYDLANLPVCGAFVIVVPSLSSICKSRTFKFNQRNHLRCCASIKDFD